MAEEVLDIMEPTNKGIWFDAECQATTEDKNKAYKKKQQGYGTRSSIEEYRRKKKNRKNPYEEERMDECRIRKLGAAKETV
jgi:hypothetical protein